MIKCCHLKIVAVSEGGQTVQVEIAVVTGLRVPYTGARIVVGIELDPGADDHADHLELSEVLA